jgi:hypothetical protein
MHAGVLQAVFTKPGGQAMAKTAARSRQRCRTAGGRARAAAPRRAARARIDARRRIAGGFHKLADDSATDTTARAMENYAKRKMD